MAYAGGERLSVGAAGTLAIPTPIGMLRDSRPVTYQRFGRERAPGASRPTTSSVTIPTARTGGRWSTARAARRIWAPGRARRLTSAGRPASGSGLVKYTVVAGNPATSDIDEATKLGTTVPCAATADTSIGSSCRLVTSVEATVPGAIAEGRRSVWELGQAQVQDEGPDGDVDTTSDNTVLMVQGVFVP
ncbi:MAG TPA: hypothetical protein VFB51_10915 [Solirubrobacterales bacterium]|nr:hypothetical protein [Solirubrobacterales bacterium]